MRCAVVIAILLLAGHISATDCDVECVLVRVTACSPDDPLDAAYYRRVGYAGRLTRAVAASYAQFPPGTELAIPGYAGGRRVPVDSPGGVVIRRSVRRGVYHIDVKFKTYQEAKRWGSKHLYVTVHRP